MHCWFIPIQGWEWLAGRGSIAYLNEATNQASCTLSARILHNEWRFPILQPIGPHSQCWPDNHNTHSFSWILLSVLSLFSLESQIFFFTLSCSPPAFQILLKPPTLFCRYLPHPPTTLSSSTSCLSASTCLGPLCIFSSKLMFLRYS